MTRDCHILSRDRNSRELLTWLDSSQVNADYLSKPIESHLLLLQNGTRRGGHQRALWGLVLALELVAHLFHRDPLDAFVLVDVFDEPAVAWSALNCHNYS